MIDVYPHARATLKDDTFFATSLSGFLDSASRFKAFIEGEAPTLESPFIGIDVQPGNEDQRNGWASPFVTFTVYGSDKDRASLWAIARKIDKIFKSLTQFALVRMTFTANATSNVVTCADHGLIDGQIVNLTTTTTLPGGLSAATDYYVVSATLDTLKLSLTEGGDAIDITNTGSGVHSLQLRRVQYALIGDAIFDQGQNPVTEMVNVSVALRFGIVE